MNTCKWLSIGQMSKISFLPLHLGPNMPSRGELNFKFFLILYLFKLKAAYYSRNCMDRSICALSSPTLSLPNPHTQLKARGKGQHLLNLSPGVGKGRARVHQCWERPTAELSCWDEGPEQILPTSPPANAEDTLLWVSNPACIPNPKTQGCRSNTECITRHKCTEVLLILFQVLHIKWQIGLQKANFILFFC